MPPLLHVDRAPGLVTVRCLGIQVLLLTDTRPPALPVGDADDGPLERAGEVGDDVAHAGRSLWDWLAGHPRG